MVLGTFLDSPDFVFLTNGNTYGYKEVMTMRPNYNEYLNQKCTAILYEKYTVLDNSTVLYTAKSKWIANYKGGHSSIADPDALLFILKKINSKWKIIYYVDSYFNRNVPGKSSNRLNQVELMKQMVGTWKMESAKDTTIYSDFKSYGTGLEGTLKWMNKGKMVSEAKQLWGYDSKIDKYIISMIVKGTDIEILVFWYTSKSKFEVMPYNDISNPEIASWKYEGEFKSPDVYIETLIVNKKAVKTDTYNRAK